MFKKLNLVSFVILFIFQNSCHKAEISSNRDQTAKESQASKLGEIDSGFYLTDDITDR